MLVLKINGEREKIKKVKGLFRKKIFYETPEDIKRYSVEVKGKKVLVLELTEKDLDKEDVITLLKMYKGRVLVSEDNINYELLKEYLFDPKAYFQRAVLSSLKNQIRTVNKEWKNICIKIDDFSPFTELFELVKISKKVTFITQKNPTTNKFLNDCYYEFGAMVSVKGECSSENDVFLDLDKIDGNGKLMINVKGKSFLLYPDTTYFTGDEEYKKLVNFNIHHNLICAAFSK